MLRSFYGIEPAFPLETHLITRCLDAELPKRLYYVSDGLLKLLLADEQEALRITSTGLKIFERHEIKDRGAAKAAAGTAAAAAGGSAAAPANGGGGGAAPMDEGGDGEAGGAAAGGGGPGAGSCHYRPVQEGLPFLLPHMTKQVAHLPLADFKLLLKHRNLGLLPDAANPDKPRLSAAAAPLIAPLLPGGAVARLAAADAAALGLAGGDDGAADDGGALAATAPLAICAWRTPASLSVLVTKTECDDMLERIAAAEARLRGAAAGGGAAAANGAAAAAAANAGAQGGQQQAAAPPAKKEEPALALA